MTTEVIIEPFEIFLQKFFLTEKWFVVDIQWDDFQKVDLIIKNNDKSKFNYDFIFIEAKNRKSIKEDDVSNFISDVEKDDFKKFNILGLFCTTKDFPTDHYKKILDAKRLILPFDKQYFEDFFNSKLSIVEFLNNKINTILELNKATLIAQEKAQIASVKQSFKNK